MIGQAFADEVFRIYAMSHPNVKLHAINASTPVKSMIGHALNSGEE